jgi:hypothetical protein
VLPMYPDHTHKNPNQLGQPDGGEQRCANRGKFRGRRWLPLALD